MAYSHPIIAAAFTTVSRLVERGENPVLTKLEGLNAVSCTYFKEAITHSFKESKDGFNLQRIFIIDNDGNWHRNTSPNKNPGDSTLIDLIMTAMSYVGKQRREARKARLSEQEAAPVSEQAFDCSNFSDELLDIAEEAIRAEKQRRAEIARKKEHLATILSTCEITREELLELLALWLKWTSMRVISDVNVSLRRASGSSLGPLPLLTA